MSVENPAVPLDEIFSETEGVSFATGENSSGVKVTRLRALGHSAMWKAVNLISGDVGRLPLKVYKRSGEGKETDPSHAAYQLLWRKPNPYMTSMIFRQTLQSHVLMSGNGYAWIERDEAFRPIGLYPLNPENTFPFRRNGVLYYATSVDEMPDGSQGQYRIIDASDVLHIRGLSFDGLVGYNVIHVLRNAIGKPLAIRDYTSRFFKNSAQPSIILEFPAGIKEEAVKNVIRSWNERHQGIDKAFMVAALREGVVAKMVSSAARDAQLVESEAYSLIDIANVTGVPPHKIGASIQSSYNSLEQENQSYLDETLDRWLTVWEEECWDKLLSEEEKRSDSHTTEFIRAALERVNLNARGEYYSKALDKGWMCRDEVRGFENLNPIPNGEGKVFYRPVNLAEVGKDAQDSPGPKPLPTADDAARSEAIRTITVDAVSRMVRRIAVNFDRAAKGGGSLDHFFAFTIQRQIEVTHAILEPISTLLGRKNPEIGREMVEFVASELRSIAAKTAEFVPDSAGNYLGEGRINDLTTRFTNQMYGVAA
jgi:HK97 family phage portal protein